MRFTKGHGGRPPGAKNKKSAAVKAALDAAFTGMGGIDSLLTWANKNPTEFYKLWVKMLVTESRIDFSASDIAKMSDEELADARRRLKLVV